MAAVAQKCGTCRELAVEYIVLPSYTMTIDHDGLNATR